MDLRHHPRRSSVVLCVIGVVVGSVMVVGSPGLAGAALSDGDCEALLTGATDVDQGSKTDAENLAAQAESLEDTADQISNKKLKKGLLRIAAVYAAAGKAKNSTAAGLVIAKRAKDYAKGFKVFGKALNKCLVQSNQ